METKKNVIIIGAVVAVVAYLLYRQNKKTAPVVSDTANGADNTDTENTPHPILNQPGYEIPNGIAGPAIIDNSGGPLTIGNVSFEPIRNPNSTQVQTPVIVPPVSIPVTPVAPVVTPPISIPVTTPIIAPPISIPVTQPIAPAVTPPAPISITPPLTMGNVSLQPISGSLPVGTAPANQTAPKCPPPPELLYIYLSPKKEIILEWDNANTDQFTAVTKQYSLDGINWISNTGSPISPANMGSEANYFKNMVSSIKSGGGVNIKNLIKDKLYVRLIGHCKAGGDTAPSNVMEYVTAGPLADYALM